MRTKAGVCIRLAPNIAPVQEWLGSINIKFYESKINLNWKPILKSIIEVRAMSPCGFLYGIMYHMHMRIVEAGWARNTLKSLCSLR